MQFELDIASCPSLVQIVCLWPLGPPNAAPEWQAKSIWNQKSELVEAFPLKGLVQRFRFSTGSVAVLRLASRAQVTSASLLTVALNFSPKAETILRIVSKLGLRSADKAL